MFEQVLPHRHERQSLQETRLRIEQKEKEKSQVLDRPWEKYRCLDKDDLRDALRAELARRDQLQRRAQTFLGSIAVLTAFSIGIVGALRSSNFILPVWAIAIPTLPTLLYLASGAWSALEAVRPGTLYDVWLQSRIDGKEKLDDKTMLDRLIWIVHITQAQNLITAILAERTYRSVRNGLFCLVGVLLLLLADTIIRVAPSVP